MSDFVDVSWDSGGNNGSPVSKIFIVIIIALIIFIGFKTGLFSNLLSLLPNDNNGVYSVEVNRRGEYNKEIRNIVEQLFPKGNKISDLEKYQVLHDFVMEYLSYDYATLESNNTTKIRNANNPRNCLLKRTTVCGGYALFYKDLCEVAGLKCDFVEGEANIFDRENLSHGWNAVYIDNNCYHVDVCWDDTGATEYEYFLRGNEYINLSVNNYRTWNGNYPFSNKNISRSMIKPIKLEVIVK